MNQYSLFKN